MPLPSVIEIEPLSASPYATIVVPGSKSITNRALILAALRQGRTTLRGALWSEDTQVMVDALRHLGFELSVTPDPAESSNRIISVEGRAGNVPAGGTREKPLELFVGNAGTAARFLAAMVCLGSGVYRLVGVPRMNERPQKGLFAALRQLGYSIQTELDRETLPVIIQGEGPKNGRCSVSIGQSSQFASALLLCEQPGGWTVGIDGDNSEEAAYVRMTREMIPHFNTMGEDFVVEPDASSASYFVGADALFTPDLSPSDRIKIEPAFQTDWQVDARFRSVLPLPASLSRSRHLGDAIMTAIVLAPLKSTPTVFEDLGRLRLQECERVHALRTELAKCGALVQEKGDALYLEPSQLHGAEIETYRDHRMAMCFALLGLKVPGMRIKNPHCVGKTFPNFFAKLASPAPFGLGAVVRDGVTRRPLDPQELIVA